MSNLIYVYDTDWNEEEFEGFDTLEDAVKYAFDELLSDDRPYMIGSISRIEAFVFQRRVYKWTHRT